MRFLDDGGVSTREKRPDRITVRHLRWPKLRFMTSVLTIIGLRRMPFVSAPSASRMPVGGHINSGDRDESQPARCCARPRRIDRQFSALAERSAGQVLRDEGHSPGPARQGPAAVSRCWRVPQRMQFVGAAGRAPGRRHPFGETKSLASAHSCLLFLSRAGCSSDT